MNSPDTPGVDFPAPENDAPFPGFNADTYVEQTAALLGLSLPTALKPGVVANFEHLQTIAQPVVEFPLAETIESAATFNP